MKLIAGALRLGYDSFIKNGISMLYWVKEIFTLLESLSYLVKLAVFIFTKQVFSKK